MPKEIKNVVVAGPNGSLGKSVIHHLQQLNLNITLLTRKVSQTNETFPGLTSTFANYDSIDELAKQLREIGQQDAILILINRDEVEAQINLIEAAIACGITHIIPSSFGIGTHEPSMRMLPIWETKVRMEDYVSKKAEEGAITFTGIQTGVFFDWALDRGVFLNTKNDSAPTIVFDGGDIPFSVTVMDDIGKAVANALLKSDDLRNKWAFINSAVVTQNQLLRYAKEAAPDKEFKVMHLDTEVMEKQSWEKWNAGERGPEVMRGFMPRVTFGKKIGEFQTTDNEVLGIREWSEDKVKTFVTSYFK